VNPGAAHVSLSPIRAWSDMTRGCERNRYLAAFVVVAVLIVLATGCASTGGASDTMIQTPALVGMSIREAEAEGAKLGIQIAVVSSEESATLPIDFILRQDPDPQTMIRKGRIVEVVTSSGPVSVVLRDLVGGTFEDAQTFITRNGLVLGDIIEKVDAAAVGTVLAQDPPPGNDLNEGAKVTLTISLGTMTAMPDLVGGSLTEARRQLAALGLEVSKVIVSPQLTQPAQLVLTQEPAAGDMIEKGGWIELTVSKVP
jgi:beta-lactam-binding protein with PASTA domain